MCQHVYGNLRLMDGEPGLRERKKLRTRQLIAETARGMFAERGFDAVPVTAIARAAEVSEATIYNYFPTKEDLVYHGMQAFENELLAAVRDRAAGTGPPRARPRRLRRHACHPSRSGRKTTPTCLTMTRATSDDHAGNSQVAVGDRDRAASRTLNRKTQRGLTFKLVSPRRAAEGSEPGQGTPLA